MILLYFLVHIILANTYAESDDVLYRECTHRTTFTDEELEIAKNYYQRRFANALIKPIRPPCERIKVRHDFKCLTHEERVQFANTFKQLYYNEVINNITEFHSRYWVSWHKAADSTPSHTLILNAAELAMDEITPGMTLPYWDVYNEGLSPDRSLIWDYFGRAGNKDNEWCIIGGNFSDVFITREQRCIRRQWNRDGSIPNWYSPEFVTSMMQSPFATFINTLTYDQHFKIHLNTGGYNGDMSVPFATYDPLFFVYHIQDSEIVLQHLLQRDETLVPLEYNGYGYYNYNAGKWKFPADISTDNIPPYEDITIAEYFQYGYGNLCSFTDRDIERALHMASNTRPPLPLAVRRLRKALSDQLFAKWFPAFAYDNYTALDITMPNLGNGNDGYDQKSCRKLPRVTQWGDNRNYNRQMESFKWSAGLNVSADILAGQAIANEFIDDINNSGYCSPYV